MKVCWKSQSRLFPCQFVTSKSTLFYFFIIYTRSVQIKHTFIIWGASFKLVFTPFYASMHWTIEPPVCASSRGRAVQREGRIRLHLIFKELIQFCCYLLMIALFSLFWGLNSRKSCIVHVTKRQSTTIDYSAPVMGEWTITCTETTRPREHLY